MSHPRPLASPRLAAPLRLYEPPPTFVQLTLPLDAPARVWRIAVPASASGGMIYLEWGDVGPKARWEEGEPND